jgi:hypothetical protein
MGELACALISTQGARAGIGVSPKAFVATDPASVGWVESRSVGGTGGLLLVGLVVAGVVVLRGSGVGKFASHVG